MEIKTHNYTIQQIEYLKMIIKLDEGSKTMNLIKIYLTNGVIIDLKCEKYEISQSRTTGEVSGYCFENATKSIAFLNKALIIAITGEKI